MNYKNHKSLNSVHGCSVSKKMIISSVSQIRKNLEYFVNISYSSPNKYDLVSTIETFNSIDLSV